MKRTYLSLLGVFGGFVATLCCPFPGLAQTAPSLGAAASFFLDFFHHWKSAGARANHETMTLPGYLLF